MRVGLSLLLLFDLGQRLFHLQAHYTDQGFLARSILLSHLWEPSWFSLFVLGNRGEVLPLFSLLALCYVALLLGWKTRLATFLAWLGLLSLHNRNPLVLDLGDAFLRDTLFWAQFLPWGSRWCLDAVRARSSNSSERPQPTLAGCSVGLLIAMIAWSVAWELARGKVSDPNWVQNLGANLPWPLMEAIIAVEVVAPVLLWLSPRKIRSRLVPALVAFHLGLAFLWPVGPLFPLLACLTLTFFDGWNEPDESSAPIQLASGFHLFLITLWIAVFGRALLVQIGHRDVFPTSWNRLSQVPRLEPHTEPFPRLPVEAALWTLEGKRRDGTDFRFGEKEERSINLWDRNWRNALLSLGRPKYRDVLPYYAHYLCRQWSPSPHSLHRVSELKVTVSRLPGQSQTFLEHRCFGSKDSTSR